MNTCKANEEKTGLTSEIINENLGTNEKENKLSKSNNELMADFFSIDVDEDKN